MKPRESAALLIQNYKGAYLMSRRGIQQSHPAALQFPGGGMEKGEAAVTCAFRETYEETGVKLKNRRSAKFIGTVGIWAPDDKPFLVHGLLYQLPYMENYDFGDPENNGIWWHWLYPEDVQYAALRCVKPLLELAQSYIRKNG